MIRITCVLGAEKIKVGAISHQIELNKVFDDKVGSLSFINGPPHESRFIGSVARERGSEEPKLSPSSMHRFSAGCSQTTPVTPTYPPQAEVFEGCVGWYDRAKMLHSNRPTYKVSLPSFNLKCHK